jgi:hypothetical protein
MLPAQAGDFGAGSELNAASRAQPICEIGHNFLALRRRLNSKNNDKGSLEMHTRMSTEGRRSRFHTQVAALGNGGAGRLTKWLAASLTLYLLMSLAQRSWILLNSDIGQLLRR